MRKKIFFIIVPILILILTGFINLWQSFASSPDYNYVTAKLDIRNGSSRIIHQADSTTAFKEKEVQVIAARYGFKNVYLKKINPQEKKGIRQYNETIEMYLNLRNGADWKYNYQKEIDSLYRVPSSK